MNDHGIMAGAGDAFFSGVRAAQAQQRQDERDRRFNLALQKFVDRAIKSSMP